MTYKTKAGRPVKMYTLHAQGQYPYQGCIDYDGTDQIEMWTKEGVPYFGLQETHSLVEVPDAKTYLRYVNIYTNGPGSFLHYSLAEARAVYHANPDYITTIPIHLEVPTT